MSGFYRKFEVDWESVENRKAYPFDLPAVRGLGSIELHPQCTFFVGENGTGKSTLLEAIAVSLGFSAEGGSRDHRLGTFDSHSSLCDHIREPRKHGYPKDFYFLRAESMYNVASYLEQTGGSRFGLLHRRSHGESFLDLVSGLRGNGVYLFDEPESALSPQRQLTLLRYLNELIDKDSQFLIATHSPILLAFPRAKIYQFSAEGVEEVAYEDTDHFRLTKAFLANPEAYLRRLFDWPEPEPEEA